jgi:hypothetical protein
MAPVPIQVSQKMADMGYGCSKMICDHPFMPDTTAAAQPAGQEEPVPYIFFIIFLSYLNHYNVL